MRTALIFMGLNMMDCLAMVAIYMVCRFVGADIDVFITGLLVYCFAHVLLKNWKLATEAEGRIK